jgi:hypothetical protein
MIGGGISRMLYSAIGGVVLVAGLVAYHVHTNEREYARGRADVLNAARVDSAILGAAQRQRAEQTAKTDTIITTVTKIVDRVRVVVQQVDAQVPDSVLLAFPVIVELKMTATRLAVAVDSLTGAIDMERAAAAMERQTLTASLTASRLETFRARDSLVVVTKQRDRRVTRLRAATGVVASFLMGAVIMRAKP